jgi:hypothetical protein
MRTVKSERVAPLDGSFGGGRNIKKRLGYYAKLKVVRDFETSTT